MFLLGVLILIQQLTNAQDKKLRMGLGFTPQVNWIKTDATHAQGAGTNMGFNFGIIADYFFAEHYSLSTGVAINNTGGTVKYNNPTPLNFKTSQMPVRIIAGDKVRYKLQYIDIPIAFKMETGKIGYFSYYGLFGVTNHIRIGAKADITAAAGNYSGVGCMDETRFFNMGYNIGGGVIWYFSKSAGLTAGAVYNHCFIDATKNENFNDNASLRSILIKLGIIF